MKSYAGPNQLDPLFQVVNQLTRQLAAHHRELIQAMIPFPDRY
jgi:hypothetical protein